MEVETKFIVPDEDTFQRLLQSSELDAFYVAGGMAQTLRDIYVDTVEWDIYQQGFACRVRWQDGTPLVTVKSLGAAEGAIHQRLEYEMPLHTLEADLLSPRLWDDGVARDIVMLIAQVGAQRAAPLLNWFTVEQTRHLSLVRDMAQEREVAELSLDVVRISAGEHEEQFWDLEAELLPTGKMSDLRAMTEILQREWGLVPESRTKFTRGLELLGDVQPTVSPAARFLLPAERAILAQISTLAVRAPQRRKANILLAWDEEKELAEIVEQAGISRSRVHYWLREFRRRRLRVFSAGVRQRGAAAAGFAWWGEQREPSAAAPAPKEEQLLDTTLRSEAIAAEEPRAEPKERAKPAPKSPGILPDDPMSEAGRKVWLFHFNRMLQREPGTRLGEDIEELHDMRVATRRMRAAFRIFDRYFEADVIKPFLQGLRRTGRALGAVRDLDVFMEKARKYLATLPKDQRGGLDPLLKVWKKQRAEEREKMLAYLDSAPYQQFVQDFGEFLHAPGKGAKPLPKGKPKPYLVRHVVPRLIYTRYETVQAYDTILEDAPLETLHLLRIDCKRLRYTLEFFREVLGAEAKDVIKEVVAVQDHLGDLHDADVADNLLRDFLVGKGRRKKKGAPRLIAPGVVAYLAVKQTELQTLMATFPETWEHVNRAEVRRWLALAVAEL